ncbi:hypothetical protein L218DRAFT_1002781 [Marasmius fiardii PR-910]|nr:hypothetical protein L218DRAFT_1002781 [Marasmius fiardii PR-910]
MGTLKTAITKSYPPQQATVIPSQSRSKSISVVREGDGSTLTTCQQSRASSSVSVTEVWSSSGDQEMEDAGEADTSLLELSMLGDGPSLNDIRRNASAIISHIDSLNPGGDNTIQVSFDERWQAHLDEQQQALTRFSGTSVAGTSHIAEAGFIITGQGKAKGKTRPILKFTLMGPSHRQVLVTFNKACGVPPMNLSMLSVTVSAALHNGGKHLKVKSTKLAYEGWSLSTSSVASMEGIGIICNHIRELLSQDQ